MSSPSFLHERDSLECESTATEAGLGSMVTGLRPLESGDPLASESALIGSKASGLGVL